MILYDSEPYMLCKNFCGVEYEPQVECIIFSGTECMSISLGHYECS